jgi:hypothetical protein
VDRSEEESFLEEPPTKRFSFICYIQVEKTRELMAEMEME